MSLPTISPLRGLVEVTRLLRAREDLPALLDAVARTIGESLGYRTVAVNVYRPEWDDFEVTTVYGNEEARAMLLGNARPGEDWTVLLSDRFERLGAYVVPAGSVDWDSLGPSYVPQGGRACHPDAWDPEDALFVPMRDHRGLLLGIVSVDEPVSGRRATDDDLEILVSLVDHAALAVEAAREAADSARHQRALEELLAVSSRITGETSNAEILRQVCTGICEALDFRNVCGALVDPETGVLVPHATAGWRLDDMRRREPITLAQVEPLLDEMFLREGCYLLTHDQARARLGREVEVYPSQLNGRGPWAWNRHWLIVPLQDGQRRAARDHLGGQPVRPARAVGRPPPGTPDLRQRRGRRAGLGPASRRAEVSRRPRSAHAPAQPARLRHPPRERGRTGCALQPQLRARGHGSRRLQAAQRPLRPCLRRRRRSSRSRTCSAESLRKPDDAFRIGGDEFAVLVAEATEEDARQVVARVETLLANLAADGEPWAANLSASFGCAACPEDASDAQTLFRLADEALYDAKRNGTVLRFVARA